MPRRTIEPDTLSMGALRDGLLKFGGGTAWADTGLSVDVDKVTWVNVEPAAKIAALAESRSRGSSPMPALVSPRTTDDPLRSWSTRSRSSRAAR